MSNNNVFSIFLVSFLSLLLGFPPNLWAQGAGFGSNEKPGEQSAPSRLRERKNLNDDANQGNEFKIDVSVVGAVSNPATFYVPIQTRLSDLLAMIEGPLPEGSLRRIEIRGRKGKVKPVDFLRFQLKGELSQNPYLQAGDVVFVGFNQNAVRILGAVRHQGEYDLVDDEKTLSQLIDFLGGFTVGFDKSGIFRISRVGDGNDRLLELSYEDAMRLPLKDGDIIQVPHVSEKNVNYRLRSRSLPGEVVRHTQLEEKIFIVGGVRMPGRFDYSPDITLREYISMAGGFQPLGKRSDIKIVPTVGKIQTVKYNSGANLQLNPGDVVDVQEKVIPPQFWISLMVTIASVGLSAVAILRN